MGYTSLDKVKADLGITDVNSDVVLSTSIDSASSLIDSYLGYTVSLKTWDEYYDMRDVPYNKFIYLKHRPIVSVTSVYFGDQLMTVDSDYIVYDEYIRILNLNSYSDNLKIQNSKIIRVVYSAGYADIPADIEYACRRLVVEMYNKKGQGNIVSESIGSWTRTFARKGVGEGLDPEIGLILDQYSRVTI